MRAVVGKENVRNAAPADAVCGMQPIVVVAPGTKQEVASAQHIANDSGLAVIPRGGGSKLTWGNRPRAADVVFSTARLNRILEHAWADLTVTVEAGCTVQELQRTLAQHGQQLAIDVLWPERATIGGILASNDSGSLRSRFGGLRDLIIGVTLVLPDGTIAKSGGKVVKNVAGYDLMKLTTGALGTLGIIAEAVFRLHPIPREQQTVTFQAANAEDTTRFLLNVNGSNLAFTGLQVRCATARAPEIDVRFEGTAAGIAAQIETIERMRGAPNGRTEPEGDPWRAREDVCEPGLKDVIAKLSFKPTDFARLHAAVIEATAAEGLRWTMVAYGHGLAWLRIKPDSQQITPEFVLKLRGRFEQLGGSLVVLDAPISLREHIDAWGNTGDALPLMRRIKQQFDPRGTLNPGRFVGGI